MLAVAGIIRSPCAECCNPHLLQAIGCCHKRYLLPLSFLIALHQWWVLEFLFVSFGIVEKYLSIQLLLFLLIDVTCYRKGALVRHIITSHRSLKNSFHFRLVDVFWRSTWRSIGMEFFKCIVRILIVQNTSVKVYSHLRCFNSSFTDPLSSTPSWSILACSILFRTLTTIPIPKTDGRKNFVVETSVK